MPKLAQSVLIQYAALIWGSHIFHPINNTPCGTGARELAHRTTTLSSRL